MNPTEFGHLMESLRGGITTPEATLLNRLAREVKQGCILEVGSFRGKSAVAMALGVRDNTLHKPQIYCIDPHQKFVGFYGGEFGPADRAAFYQAMLQTHAYEEVALINLSSEIIAPGWQKPIGMAFIDGDHSYEGVKRDYECWLSHVIPGGLIVFDDAADPQCGPAQLLREIMPEGKLEFVEQVGKIIVTRKKREGAIEYQAHSEQNLAGSSAPKTTIQQQYSAHQESINSQILGGMQATYLPREEPYEPEPQAEVSVTEKQQRLRLLIVMERPSEQFGTTWGKRLAETIYPHGFDLVFCYLDRTSAEAVSDSLSMDEALQVIWDCTCFLGKFNTALIDLLRAVFTNKRFGTRVELIDEGQSSHVDYLPVNRALMPHITLFLAEPWTPGSYTKFYSHRFYALDCTEFMLPSETESQSPERLRFAQSFLDKLYVDDYEHYTYAPEMGLHGKWPLDIRTQGLETVLSNLNGKYVIDFGCAEGFISRCCLEAGATQVDGFEYVGARVDVARNLCEKFPNASFNQADISDWKRFVQCNGKHLRLGYDLVLYLGVHQHLPKQSRLNTLRGITELALDYLVIRMPPADFEKDEVAAVLADCGFKADTDYKPSETQGLGGALVFRRR